jgi:hypothetical protein
MIGLNVAFRPRNDEGAPVKWAQIEVEQVDSNLIAAALEEKSGLPKENQLILRANVNAVSA